MDGYTNTQVWVSRYLLASIHAAVTLLNCITSSGKKIENVGPKPQEADTGTVPWWGGRAYHK